MKKLKTLSTALIAAAVVLPTLSGCVIGGVPGAPTTDDQQHHDQPATPKVNSISFNKTSVTISIDEDVDITATVNKTGDISDEVTWSLTSDTIATIVSQTGKKATVAGLAEGTVYLKATSKGDTTVYESIKITVIKPAVNAVSIAEDEIVVGLNLSNTISATVTSVGIASGLNDVDWSIENSSIAKIMTKQNNDVTIKGVSVGETTLTVTSKYDTTKTDTITVKVIDKGFSAELYDAEFAFSYEVPSKLATFIGTTAPSFGTYDKGFYYVESEGDTETAPFAKLYMWYDATTLSAIKTAFADFGYFYDDYYECDIYIDPTITYEADVYVDYDENDSERAYVVTFYHAEDIWDSTEATADVAWNEDAIKAFEDYGFTLPFVALGSEGYTVEAGDGYVAIYDYCADYTLLDDYAIALTGDGYVAKTIGEGDEAYTVYEKTIDEYSKVSVMFYFCSYGNVIDCEIELIEQDAFPETAINTFVTDTLLCNGKTVPVYATATGKYTWSKGSATFDDAGLDIRDCGVIGVSAYDADELETYKTLLTTNDFVANAEDSFEKQDGMTVYSYSKGRLGLEVILNYAVIEPTEAQMEWAFGLLEGTVDGTTLTDEEFDLANEILGYMFGMSEGILDYDTVDNIQIVAYAYPTILEVPGLYFTTSYQYGCIGKNVTVTPTVHELVDPTIAFASSDEEVATVDSTTGEVTFIKEGTVTITATTNVSDVDYSASTTFEVVENHTVNELLTANEFTTDFDLTEPEDFICVYNSYDSDVEEGLFIAGLSSQSAEDYIEVLIADGFKSAIDEDDEEFVHDSNCAIYVADSNGYLTITVFDYTPVSNGVTFDYSEISSISETIGDFTIDAHKTGSEAVPAIYDNEELRVYSGNELTISSTGDPITSIDFYTCDCTKKVGATFMAKSGTLTITDYGYHWEGNATSVTFTCTKVDDDHKQSHFFSIEINGGGEGGGTIDIDIDVDAALEDIEDITVAIAAKYLKKSESSITVDYDDGDADVYVWDYSDYGFICSDFSITPTGNEQSDLAAMKAALPSGVVLDTENTLEEDDYHDIWYTYGDYSIGIYYYDGEASFAVVPTEMLEIYFYMMYGE